MTEEKAKIDYDDVESRRGFVGRRRMSTGRRIYYFLGLPILRFIVWLILSTYRVEKVIGEEVAERVISDGKVYAPCYWHQHTVLCLFLMRSWIRRGFKGGFIVSPSVDGEVPASIARKWGAEVIRGSANQSGALALRDMQRMMKSGFSMVTTADGPRGPKYEFKMGAILMARIAGVPVIPIGCASDRAWYLDRWDNFMVPKPFARIVVAVGEPIPIPSDAPLDGLEPYRISVQQAVMSLMADSESVLHSR